MAALSAADILRVWEWGGSRHAVDRALLILSAAAPGSDRDELAALTLGQRDARLLQIRSETFGSSLPGAAICPECATELDFAVDSGELVMAREGGANEPFEIAIDDLLVRLRCLDSLDLAEAAQADGAAEARRILLHRSVLAASRDGLAVGVDELAEPALERISSELEARDPQAEIGLDLRCPECGNAWTVALDIGEFLWSEIGAMARGLLQDVHCLACAYGWSEDQILSLSPARRQAYLELASG